MYFLHQDLQYITISCCSLFNERMLEQYSWKLMSCCFAAWEYNFDNVSHVVYSTAPPCKPLVTSSPSQPFCNVLWPSLDVSASSCSTAGVTRSQTEIGMSPSSSLSVISNASQSSLNNFEFSLTESHLATYDS